MIGNLKRMKINVTCWRAKIPASANSNFFLRMAFNDSIRLSTTNKKGYSILYSSYMDVSDRSVNKRLSNYLEIIFFS